MKTLQFTKIINAPAQKVWEVLWNEDTYPRWTKAFNLKGGSFVQSDWQVGGKTLFLDEKGNGMISTIKSKKEPYEIVFEHVGEIINGVENTFIEKIKNGSGFLEEYILKEKQTFTNLKWDNKQLGFNLENKKKYYTFSVPYFNLAHDKAIVMYKYHCPGLCGGGSTILLTRTQKGWDSTTLELWFH